MREFVDAYSDAVAAFVASADEESRERAYEVGRLAIRNGLGVLDISRIHSLALEEHPELDTSATTTWQFFSEVLAPFEMALRGVRDANATLKRFNQMLEERVTERTSALRTKERELEEQSAVLRGVLDAMADGVLVVDRDLRLTLANRAAGELLGVDEETVRGTSRWSEDAVFLEPDERTPVSRDGHALARALQGEVVRETSVFVRPAGGTSSFHLQVSASPLRGETGSVASAVLVFRDVTARKRAEAAAHRAEERLLRAQKLDAVGQLAGGIAHDFNNLLAVVLSYCNLLLDDLPKDDARAADVLQIQRAANSAATLTRQLLAFSRQQVLQLSALDLNDVVDDLARMLRRTLGEHVELATALGRNVPHILADRGQIEQVLMNLAVNARDAMPSGGRLMIETGRAVVDGDSEARGSLSPGEYVVLSVTDTGTGMDDATKARIFEPFFTTKERGRGTGLGLATVYGIAQQSGGTVTVYSELGKGTTFRVYLPQARVAANVRGAGFAEVAARGTETLLLVEDEERVRIVATRVLKAHGYDVLVAGTPAEARALFHVHKDRIALLVTDVVMPGTTGPVLADELRSVRPTLPVLFTSGYAPGGAFHAGHVPADAAFLEKPFTADSLRSKVRQVLDREARP